VIVAHIMGIPVEESIGQLAPAAAVTATATWLMCREAAERMRRRVRRRGESNGAPAE
jgi:hypothetical protein